MSRHHASLDIRTLAQGVRQKLPVVAEALDKVQNAVNLIDQQLSEVTTTSSTGATTINVTSLPTLSPTSINLPIFYLVAAAFSDHTPTASKVAWTGAKVALSGTPYYVADGNTASKYVVWSTTSPNVFSGASSPPTGAGDYLVAINTAGVVSLVWDKAQINGGQIQDQTITATQIANATITGTQIASATIAASNIVLATITASQIANATITGTQIASATIAAANIVNATITSTQIANNTITSSQIANNTITASQIANNTITASQIANNTVTASQIASLTITAAEIANLTITGGKIANATITEANIYSLSVGGGTGRPGAFNVYDAAPAIIGTIGNLGSSNYGIWGKQVWAGGTGPSDAPFKTDTSGRVSIDATDGAGGGALLSLVKGSVTTTIANATDGVYTYGLSVVQSTQSSKVASSIVVTETTGGVTVVGSALNANGSVTAYGGGVLMTLSKDNGLQVGSYVVVNTSGVVSSFNGLASFSGAVNNITVANGIVTAASGTNADRQVIRAFSGANFTTAVPAYTDLSDHEVIEYYDSGGTGMHLILRSGTNRFHVALAAL